MKKLTVGLIAGMLAISGCSAPSATQTGGGSSTAESKPSETQVAVTPGTIADVVAQGWLAGTANPTFPVGVAGKTNVVATGPIVSNAGGTSVPIAVRNNTSSTISALEVTGAATDGAGMIVGSGRSQGFNPQTIQPGGVTLGFVYFDPNTKLPADTKLEFTVASTPVKGAPYFRDLKIEQANLVGDSIAGKATNTSKDKLNGPYSVQVTCFDESGALLSTTGAFASPMADLESGQSVTFQVSLYSKPCPSFLLGVSGYGPLN